MFESIPAPPHVAAFRFTGTLTGQDYDHVIAEIESRLVEYQRIAVLADLTGLSGMSVEAMGKDFRYALSKLGEYSRFARAAVITDQDWLGKISELGGHLLPGTEVRAFASAQAGDALDWVMALPAEDVRESGLH